MRTQILSESTKAFNSENIGQVCLVSSKTHRANKDFSNPAKDALAFRFLSYDFLVIGLFLQSTLPLRNYYSSTVCDFPYKIIEKCF